MARDLSYDELADDAQMVLREVKDLYRKLKDDAPAETKAGVLAAFAAALDTVATIQYYKKRDS